MFRSTPTPEIPPGFAIKVEDLVVTAGSNRLLNGVSLQIDAGEYVGIVGPSGAGKTTLANCIRGIYTGNRPPERGSVRYGDVSIFEFNDQVRTELRGRHFGSAFQDPILDANLTAEENIKLAARLEGRLKDSGQIDRAIDLFGIRSKLGQRARTLSAGEQERVSIVRALANDPSVLFLDEPTSALDKELKKETNEMLRNLAHEIGKTVLVITHEETNADRIITLTDGQVVTDIANREVSVYQPNDPTALEPPSGKWSVGI